MLVLPSFIPTVPPSEVSRAPPSPPSKIPRPAIFFDVPLQNTTTASTSPMAPPDVSIPSRQVPGKLEHCIITVQEAPSHTGEPQAGPNDPFPTYGSDSDEDDEDSDWSCCPWQYERHLVARTARWFAAHPILEGLNIFFISFFLLAFIAVEMGARESQYRPIMLIFSPWAIAISTITVGANLLALIDKRTCHAIARNVLRRYLFRIWNMVDIIIIIVLWVRLADAYKPPNSDAKDGDGFDNVDSDGSAGEWYYLIALRALHLVGLLRGIAPSLHQRSLLLFDLLLVELNLKEETPQEEVGAASPDELRVDHQPSSLVASLETGLQTTRECAAGVGDTMQTSIDIGTAGRECSIFLERFEPLDFAARHCMASSDEVGVGAPAKLSLAKEILCMPSPECHRHLQALDPLERSETIATVLKLHAKAHQVLMLPVHQKAALLRTMEPEMRSAMIAVLAAESLKKVQSDSSRAAQDKECG